MASDPLGGRFCLAPRAAFRPAVGRFSRTENRFDGRCCERDPLRVWMTRTDAAGDENDRRATDDPEGAVAIETATGLLVYESGRPDAWIHAAFDCAIEE